MIKTYIVDSFTDEPFKGNPAGVCLLDFALEENQMLKIAQELGLSETAFVRKNKEGEGYRIRYFSPKMEIPLCGHATLASAKILMSSEGHENVRFTTIQNIELDAKIEDGLISMKFPLYRTSKAQAPTQLLSALGIASILNAEYNEETKILILEIDNTRVLANLSPDFRALLSSHDSINGVLITAASKGDSYDFHSRYFWPWSGADEDPATGGTHTFLTSYWSKRLGKTKMRSFQSSERTGWMEVEIIDADNFYIRSQAVIVFEGTLQV